jgi:hypothetical protein
MLRYTIVLALGAAGCAAHPTLSFPNVPAPVLLGPVDRVGGGQADATERRPMNVEVERWASATRYGYRGRFDDERKASFAALVATDAKRDADVRIHEVSAGAWCFSPIAGIALDEWVAADGEARRKR